MTKKHLYIETLCLKQATIITASI